MTYTPPRYRPSAETTEADSDRVSVLEKKDRGTPMQRGELAALRIRSSGILLERVLRLTDKWEGR